jgi:hypothetical protein
MTHENTYRDDNRAYSEVNVKYFNPLTYDSITKIASL